MSAQPPILQQAERVRVWWRLFVLVIVLAGVVAVVAGIASGDAMALAGCLSIAVLFWSGAAFIHLTWLAQPAPDRRTTRVQLPEGVGFRLDLRPQLPLAMLSLGVGFAVICGFMVFVVHPAILVVLVALIGLLGLVLIPDALRALAATDRGAVLDAEGLTYRGYSYETRVAWDDIASGDLDKSNPRLPAMTLRLRPGLTLTWTRRWWIAHLEPSPKESGFTVPAIVLDQPWNFLALCTGMAQAPPGHRERFLESVGTTMLTGAGPRQ